MTSISQSFSGASLGIALISGLSGFLLSQALTARLSSSAETESQDQKRDADVANSVDDVDQGDSDAPLEITSGPIKLVLVVRTDCKMSAGKIAAQCGHGTLAAYKATMRRKNGPELLRAWERVGQAKIVVSASSEDELRQLMKTAHGLNIVAEPIVDAGRTEVAPNTMTVLAVGPGPVKVIDQVTKHLSIFR